MPTASSHVPTRRMPLAKISAVARAAVRHAESDLWKTPIDRNRYFVCPTTTPLYYSPIYQELSLPQRRRYNQLTAIQFSELISFFESEFAASVCAALAGADGTEADLTHCLKSFVADEQEHIELWRRLTQLSEPDWPHDRGAVIFRVSPFAVATLKQITRRPNWFPFVYWVMLALEERSLDISRRCLQADRDQIEPHYRWAYHEHLKDEVRHVQIDWHLIDRYYAGRSTLLRRGNAWMLRKAIASFLLPPKRAAIRVVERLVCEHPELQPRLSDIKRQLRSLAANEDYHQMMFSRETTPITFSIFDRFAEMRPIEKTLFGYTASRD